MKDNDPQTVGELLNSIRDKGRAGMPPQASLARNGKRRPRARAFLLALLFIGLAAASVYFFRGYFSKTGKQTVAVRPGESPLPKSEAAPINSPAAVNTLSTPATQALPAQEPAGTTAPQVASGEMATGVEGSLTVQVGSYAAAAEAARQVERLKAAGVASYIVKASVPGHGVTYRVQAGRFKDRDEAARYGAQLRADGLARDYFITPVGEQ